MNATARPVPTAASFHRRGVQRRRRTIFGLLALALVAPGPGASAEPPSDTPVAAPVAPPPEDDWGKGSGKSYFIPALEIPAFEWLLNRFDRAVWGNEIYGTTWDTGWRHVNHGPWTFDTDPFAVNMVLHPYQGSLYFGFARSAGLNFWESFGYTLAGSFLWENFGELGNPSINDQAMTGVGGSFFGEALFRMAGLLLEGDPKPGFWRELGAAVISPPTGLNRLAFGDKFDSVWASHDPATFIRWRLGYSHTAQLSDQGFKSSVDRDEATGDFSMAYGLPGKPGYAYTRPFDYFHFQLTARASTGVGKRPPFENVEIRGLVYGSKYSGGDSYRGIWGLYGSYDYISPEIFRVSSSAFSVGTTAQWWLSQYVALQGSLLGGLGFGAAGTIAVQGTPAVGERDYHFGLTPQALLALRLTFGKFAMLDGTAREYYVSGVASDNSDGAERIFRGTASFTVRIFGGHGVGIQYVQNRRDAYYSDLPDRHQTIGTFSLAYTFLGTSRFGAVEWRDPPANPR